MIWRMRWCRMTWFRKGECSRLSAQHKKNDLWSSECVRTVGIQSMEVSEDERSWRVGLCIDSQEFSQVVRSSPSWGKCNREKSYVLKITHNISKDWWQQSTKWFLNVASKMVNFIGVVSRCFVYFKARKFRSPMNQSVRGSLEFKGTLID